MPVHLRTLLRREEQPSQLGGKGLPWQQRGETQEEREAYLGQRAEEAKERVRQHISVREPVPLVIALRVDPEQ